jgi:hypothetical protein
MMCHVKKRIQFRLVLTLEGGGVMALAIDFWEARWWVIT